MVDTSQEIKPSTRKEMRGSKEWWRVLSLTLQGIGYNTFESFSETSPSLPAADRPVELHVILRKPTWHGHTISMRGKLSFVDLTLKYSEYVLLRAVLRDNIGRDIDMNQWDNIEKAYWMEEARIETMGYDGDNRMSRVETQNDTSGVGRVTYASDARFIRYGKKAETQQHESLAERGLPAGSDEKPGLDFKFDLDGLSLTLHRDDALENTSEFAMHDADMIKSFNYDVVLFRVQVAVISVSTNSAGDNSFHLSLNRIGLIDLGDFGRLARDRYYQSLPDFHESKNAIRDERCNVRNPCAFCVMAEGYSPSEKQALPQPNEHHIEEVDPNLLLTVERVPESSSEFKALHRPCLGGTFAADEQGLIFFNRFVVL